MDFYFLDTSAVIKAYIREVGSNYITGLLGNSDNVLFVAVITGAEGIAGLNKRHRMGDISTSRWNTAQAGFLRDYRHRFKKTQIFQAVIDKAISLLNIPCVDMIQCNRLAFFSFIIYYNGTEKSH